MVNEDIVRLNELWSNPEEVSAAHLGWLEELVEQFPASVPLWWLYLRAVQRAEAPNFALVLHRTASISPNRSALMDWVEQPFREEIPFRLQSPLEGTDSEIKIEHQTVGSTGDVQTEVLELKTEASDDSLEKTESLSEPGKLSNQLAGHETEPLEEQAELLEKPFEKEVLVDPEVEVTMAGNPEISGVESTALEAKTEFPEHVQAALDRARKAREQIVNVRSLAKPAALESNEIGLKLPEERREDSPNSPKKLVVDPTTDEGVVEQDEAVTGGNNLQEVETFEERTLVSTADELEIAKVDLASKAPLDEPYELRSPSANPQGPIDPQAKTDEDLSKLPDRVREQILRARSTRAKLAEVGIVSPSNALNLKAASEVQLENSEERAQDSNEVQPSSILDQSGVQEEESLQSNAVVKSEPSRERTAKKSKSNLEILSEEDTVSGDLIGQTSKQRKPKNVARDRTSTAPSPEKTASSSPEASPTSTIGLSPFAQFVAALGAPNSAPDQGQLIDQFLAENPRITPLAKDAPAPEVRTQPDEQVTGLVTETLARMYAEQGHVGKAIQAYEILKLRVPEKSSIFAARIEALKTK